jgi:hypothetical protein
MVLLLQSGSGAVIASPQCRRLRELFSELAHDAGRRLSLRCSAARGARSSAPFDQSYRVDRPMPMPTRSARFTWRSPVAVLLSYPAIRVEHDALEQSRRTPWGRYRSPTPLVRPTVC